MKFNSAQSLTDLRERKCPICDDPPYICFNWESSPWPRKEEEHKEFVKNFAKVQDLKFGSQYQCKICGLNWWFDHSNNTMNRIPERRFELFMEWNSKHFTLTTSQFEILDSIGGTGPDFYGNNRDIITIPCAIRKSNGQHIDPCIILITKKPPIDDYKYNIELFCEIREITRTDYALPLEIRIESVCAREISMGFAPTCVESISGQQYILNWSTCLFDDYGVKGKGLRLTDKNTKIKEPYKFPKPENEYATYFFVDWFEEAEKLIKSEQRRSQVLREYEKQRKDWDNKIKSQNLLRDIWELIK